MQEWLRPKEVAEYCSVSERTISSWLKSGLSYSKVGNIVLVSRQVIDRFIKEHSVDENKIDSIVDDVLEGLS